MLGFGRAEPDARLEEDFYSQLPDPRISNLASREGAKGARVELLEIIESRLGRDVFVEEVHAVKHVEILRAKLKLPPLRERKVFGEAHVPVVFARHPEGILAGEAVGSFGACCGRESSRIEPAKARS